MLASLFKLKLYSKVIPTEFQTFKRGVFMKILVLTSGGDAPGMNQTIYQLKKSFKDDLYASLEGFKGLINGKIVKVPDCRKEKNKAGSIIFSSRCPEFATREGFSKALENAKKFDYIIVLGGNGSYKGCKELNENGVKTVFIPSTIDNDVDISEYSQGFGSAVSACEFYIKNSMPSMQAFNRCAIFEVMGRKCDKIAKETFLRVKGDYLIANEEDLEYDKISRLILDNHKQHRASSIILRENIVKIEEFKSKLSKLCPKVEIKTIIIGYIQRGIGPTKKELKISKQFARYAIWAIKAGREGTAIVVQNNKVKAI